MRKKITPADIDPAEKWLAQSLLGDLVNSLRPEDLTVEIKNRLFGIIYNALIETNQKNPPFIPELLFDAFDKINFQKEETTLPENKYGMLTPVKNGFIIRIDSSIHPFRQRLVIAHEIGHAFFYDWESEIPTLRFSNSRYWVQEGYALEIARSILLPKFSIEEVVKTRNLSPSLSSIDTLRYLYEISYDVLFRRLIHDLNIWDCLIFTSAIEGKTVETKGSNIFKGVTYKNLKIPKSITETTKNYESLFSVIFSAYKRRTHEEDKIRIGKKEYTIKSSPINYDNQNTIISLIR